MLDGSLLHPLTPESWELAALTLWLTVDAVLLYSSVISHNYRTSTAFPLTSMLPAVEAGMRGFQNFGGRSVNNIGSPG